MPHLRSLLVGGAAGALAAFAVGDAPAVRAQSLTCSTDTDSDNGLFLKAAILVLAAPSWVMCALGSGHACADSSRAWSPGGLATTRVGETAPRCFVRRGG